ncbi:hypothetical protein GOZ83_13675 [Agrobacterium vitis]|uniref:hypothetical protein n=1 Tax=Rhizobium/Agrobacterium group TaxID=227290 RepID=UPI0012E7D3EC|nr:MULTISPECIES: hypothetical protein [Rhizobium/Agrobacterium group]MCF1491799.1 hypothetical protein [Allorhizobium ampelinum]MVA46111.1 hypothetical protein [Agrobacterium vitis]
MGLTRKTIIEEIEAFGEQWLLTLKEADKAVETKNFDAIRDHVILNGIRDGGNFVNQKGYEHLRNTVDKLLVELGMTRRLTASTMEGFISTEFFEELARLKRGKKFSVSAIVNRAKTRVETVRWDDGSYIFPVQFAPKAKNSDFRIGPARIVAKAIYIKEKNDALERERANDSVCDRLRFLEDWEFYIDRYDHFITVEMKGFEVDLAWESAREAAEFCLNMIRLVFGYYHTRNIKLSGGYIWDQAATKLMIQENGRASFSSSSGPWGSHLDDNWTDVFTDRLGFMSGTIASLCALLASGEYAGTPILERQRYAHQLIAEAYCEPHDHIRLVRLVSALEALAMLEKTEKKQSLALSCAQAGGWADPSAANEIYEAVMAAYAVRNRIVHGDGAPAGEINRAFYGLEGYLLDIIEGYVLLYVGIWNSSNPKHVGHLRKELKRRSEMFFWSSSLAF